MRPGPLLRALDRLARAKVDFLLIGVHAINHYAPDASAAYATQDCDILLRPDSGNLAKALRALGAAGYRLEAGGEPLPPADPLLIRRLLERRALVTARKPGSLPIDLALEAAGLPYAGCARRRRMFRACGVRLPVAALADLIRSKRLSGREKDRAFLRLYEARLREWLAPSSRRPKASAG